MSKLLAITGLGLITASVFMGWGIAQGLAATGVSLLLIDWRYS